MIRKFSITNSTQLLSLEDQQRLEELGSKVGSLLFPAISNESGNDAHQDIASEMQCTSTRSTDTSSSRVQHMAAAGDYEQLYMTQSDRVSLDEGLSMSDEEERIPLDIQEFNSKLLESMAPEEKLLAAAQRGHGPMVKDLLMQGTQLAVDQNGSTALHQAAQSGFADVIRILLDHGADIDAPDSGGYTALHKAAGKGHLDVLGLLINEGCQIDIQDDTYGNTSLHEAAWKGFSKSVDLLLKNKSNAFIANRAGCTALHLAAQSGHNQSGRALLYAGCSPDVKNNYGDTPLHTAARYGHAGIARILISARCSVSEQNKNGDTSLHIAAAFKRRKIATLLVEGDINVQLTNKQGETATDIARRKEHMSIIEIIHRGHSKPTGGVNLHSISEHSRTQSSQQNTLSREATPDTNRDNKKKSSGLVSWIKKKFAKEKLEKEQMGKTITNNARSTAFDDGSLGLFSQYVKRQGFAYYRDLAGNIRQGPVGYVPNCHCESSKRTSGLDPLLHNHMTSTKHKQCERTNGLELQDCKLDHGINIAAQERLLAERQDCLERLKKLNEQEKLTAQRPVVQEEVKLRDDLQSWLATQRSDDPFSYSIGTKQQRFGDDFDHQRIARYEAMNSEQFLPPPRLFRSRSDETLTHSEYSFHGRAFKSKEAAMEELKTLKHHEEIRERRKLIRAGVKEQEMRAGQADLTNGYYGDSKPKELDPKQKPGLWMSRDHLDDDHSRTDTGCESHDTPKKDVPDGHLMDTTITAVKPERVKGRRERSLSPERKPSVKATTSVPLKSAMRQPRGSTSSGNEKLTHVYRSSSLPRDSRIEFRTDNPSNAEPKKTVKTVRYNETVKSTEIAQDMPPSLSPSHAEEILLPAKREAPIGGHDEKYSETTQPLMPPYQKLSDDTQSKDLRDSIVNARKELLARKPEGMKTPDNIKDRNKIPSFERPQDSTGPVNRNDFYPQFDRRISNGPQTDSRSLYYSQDGLRQAQTQQPAIPFIHYANGYHARQLSQSAITNRVSQQYASSSLPRPPRNSDGQKNANAGHRAPLPSYEEIQSNRMGFNNMRPPPNYLNRTQTGNQTNSNPPHQPNISSKLLPQYPRQPNQQLATQRGRQPNHINSTANEKSHTIPNRQLIQPNMAVQKPPPPVTKRQTSINNNVTNQQSANTINGQPGWFSHSANQPHNNISQKPAPVATQFRNNEISYPKPFPDEPIADMTSVNNGGSCSSSNPDSGYSGNFYESNTNRSIPVDYNTWYQQSIQSTALKMTAMNGNRPMSRSTSQPVVTNTDHLYRNTPHMNGHKRLSYTNMTSDV